MKHNPRNWVVISSHCLHLAHCII